MPALKPKGKHGGPRPGSGRPAGSVNKWAGIIRTVAGTYAESAVERAAEIALLKEVPAFYKSGRNKGKPIMMPAFNADGSPKLHKGQPVLVQKTTFMTGVPFSAQMDALKFITERAGGKPTQPMANDPDDPLTDLKPSGKVVFGPMPAATPKPANQDKAEDDDSQQSNA